MPRRLVVGHELFKRGNYAKIASLRFHERKKRKKRKWNRIRFASYRSILSKKSPIPFLFENLSPFFVLPCDRDIILYMAQRVIFFYLLLIDQKKLQRLYIFVLTNLRYLQNICIKIIYKKKQIIPEFIWKKLWIFINYETKYRCDTNVSLRMTEFYIQFNESEYIYN